MRLFVSVDLPDDHAPPIKAIQQELEDASGLSFTDPAQAHLTLKFLGDTDSSQLPALKSVIADAVANAGVEPFDATVAGLGAFPSHDYIQVVWIGVDTEAGELTQLHEAIERETTALGFEPEDHDFTPHVTIARMNHAGGKALVQEVLGTDPVVGTMTVEEVLLKESTLMEEGPIYSTVETFPL